jgi:hypothetical protein
MTATTLARCLRYQTGLRTSGPPGSVVGCLVVVGATLLSTAPETNGRG